MSFNSRNTPIAAPLGCQRGRLGIGPFGLSNMAFLKNSQIDVPADASGAWLQFLQGEGVQGMTFGFNGNEHTGVSFALMLFPGQRLYMSSREQLDALVVGIINGGTNEDTFIIQFFKGRIGFTT